MEGLQEGDLRDLVLPLISIDQYFPKSGTDDEVIVLAFFVSDADAAKDFTRFVSKTSAKILDVEPSPAPNPEGYWLVFVEMMRNAETIESILTILDESQAVTKIKKYKARIYKVGTTVEVNQANLKKYVDWEHSEQNDEIREWLSSGGESFKFTSNNINETAGGKKFITLYFGDIDAVPEQYECMECFGNQTSTSRTLAKALGSDFEALDFGDYVMISKLSSNKILLVKST
jgi:hypothetical protein